MEETDEPIPEHEFSKSVYIIITTHGCIGLKSSSELRTFEVPEGINIINIMASPPGVLNTSSYISLQNAFETINGGIDISKSNGKDLSEMPVLREVIGNINEDLKLKDREINTVQQTENKTRYKLDKRLLDLSHSWDTRFIMKSYKSGDEILNKQFSYDSTENNIHWLDNKIQIFNLPQQNEEFNFLDFLHSLERFKDGTSGYVLMNMIIHYLKERGVENVVIFDFSCSKIASQTPISNRGVRSLRRYMPYGGGKKHTYRKEIYRKNIYRKHTYRKHTYRKKRRTTRRYKK